MKQWIQRHRAGLVLAAIMIAQLLYITYQFAFVKEGFHSDDGWSYEFSNANHETWIHKTPEGKIKNCNEWLDTSIFRGFITVEKGTEFSYDTVLYNMSDERNPPFHSILLHTVCSFFPDTFSWWYGYIVNIFCFFLTLIGLYYFSAELMSSKKLALLTCAFYGFTTGAESTFLFLRGYSFVTGLAVWLCYLHCRMCRKRFEKIMPQLAWIIAVMVLGALTHYEFLMLGMCFTIVFGIYALGIRKWKPALLYGAAMALSVGIVFALWPRTLEMFLSRNEMYAAQMPFRWQIKMCIYMWVWEATGAVFRFPDIVFLTYVKFVLIFVSIFVAGIAFLLRKEEKFRRGVKRAAASVQRIARAFPKRFRGWDKRGWLIFFSCAATLAVIAKLCDIYGMGNYADRYLFFLMPPLVALFIYGLAVLFRGLWCKRKWGRQVFALLLAGAMVCNHVKAPCPYLFLRYCDGTPIEELVADANVIVLMSEDWNLSYYAPLFRNSKRFFATRVTTCLSDEVLESLKALDAGEDEPVFLVAESDRMTPDDYEKDPNQEEDIRVNDEILRSDAKVSDVVREYGAMDWAGTPEKVQEEHSFFGILSVWRLR